MPATAVPYVVLVPVRSPGTGKSRLGLSDADRTRLAAAFAIDAVGATLATAAVRRVLVTTDDDAFGRTLADLGAEVCADPGHGLNAALRAAAGLARTRWPDAVPVALCADLPALRATDLADALAQSGGRASYVADGDGTGTTLYTAPYDDFTPRFGERSADAHAATGARPVAGELAGLRRDVDDLEDLRAAEALGVGPATRAALDLLGRARPADRAG